MTVDTRTLEMPGAAFRELVRLAEQRLDAIDAGAEHDLVDVELAEAISNVRLARAGGGHRAYVKVTGPQADRLLEWLDGKTGLLRRLRIGIGPAIGRWRVAA